MAVALQAGARVVAVAAAGGRAGSASHEQWPRRVSCATPPRLRTTIGVATERKFRRRHLGGAGPRAAGDGVETEVEAKTRGDVLPSHEWPENFSLLNFEDLISHYEPALFKAEAQPGTYLADVMSTTIYPAFVDQKLSEVNHFFENISGLPVVDSEFKVVGVISKKDRNKAAKGEDPKVTEIMSSPAITLSADKTVQDAAVLMLKNKIHRIPVLNSSNQVVGMVTRTDIFTALDNVPKSP